MGQGDIYVARFNASTGFNMWARRLGSFLNDQGLAVGVDDGGNVITVGRFAGTADFDPTPGSFPLVSKGMDDGFISKLSSSGGFLWAGQLGGAGQDWPASMTVDAAGSIYSVGTFTDTADFDPGPASYNMVPTFPGDAFISKLTRVGAGDVAGLAISRIGASLQLTWDPSCSSNDADFEVYEGVLGTFYSHVPVQCSTGGGDQRNHRAWSG